MCPDLVLSDEMYNETNSKTFCIKNLKLSCLVCMCPGYQNQQEISESIIGLSVHSIKVLLHKN